MSPPQVDMLSIISARAHRYFANEDSIGGGFVLRGDSRDPKTFKMISKQMNRVSQSIGLIIMIYYIAAAPPEHSLSQGKAAGWTGALPEESGALYRREALERV